jgi:ribose transport system substrate-binding protein
MPAVVKNETGKALRIEVIPKGLTHEHWKAVEAGARRAGQEAGNVEIIWQGPPKEDDTNQQINLVQSCVSGGVNGIVLAPLSDQALVGPVRMAARANIPVVIIDSALRGTLGQDYIAYVGTNNKEAGRIAGKRLAELLKPDATVMMLRYAESSASTNEREQGFLESLHANASFAVKVIDPPRYAGADVNSAKQAAENMLTAYQGQFTAIFCPNESSTEGMLLALNDRQLSGKVTFVGFDVNKRLIDALKAGKIQGLVLQNPHKMGYDGVRVLLAYMNGRPVPTDVDTGAVLVTPENLTKPEIDAVVPASAK